MNINPLTRACVTLR